MSITWKESRPPPKVSLAYQRKLVDDPSWTVCAHYIEFSPDASSPPHKHGGANVIGYVISGEVLSAMNDGEAKVYKAGESWHEEPGCFHRIADNASTTQPAVLFATLVIKTEVLEKHGLDVLFQIEPEYQEGAGRQFARGS